MSKTHSVVVSMISRNSLMLEEGATVDSHHGVWWCDPTLYPGIEIGDTVRFMCCGEEIASGKVTEVIDAQSPLRKYCSGLNTFGFKWSKHDVN